MSPHRLWRSLGSVMTMLYLPLAMAGGLLSLLLLFVAECYSSRLVAIAVLLLLPLPLMLYFRLFLPLSRRWGWTAGGMLLTALICLTTAWGLTPSGQTPAEAPFQSVYANPPGFQRASLANLVPEIDQFTLGSYLLSRTDPVIDQAQSARVRKLFLQVYREMRRSENYTTVGSSMNLAYRNMLLGTPPALHYYLYLPERLKGQKVPLIVFLHGSGGNFKGYMWLWGKYAEEHGVAVLAPDYGFGNWYQGDGADRVREVMELAEAHGDFQVSSRILVGLSNGGHGTLLAGAALAEQIDAAAMISPVMTTPALSTEAFARAWGSRPLFVIHGDQDRRIPAAYVQNTCRKLHQLGVPVHLEMIPEEDHFLMFSQWQTVSDHLAEWMKAERIAERE